MATRAREAEMAPPGRVFVVQHNPHLDYSDAARYGTLTPVLRRDVFADDFPSRLEAMKEALEKRMGDYDPTKDFLLLTGDPVAIFLAGMLLREAKKVRVLKFDREVGRYYDIVIEQ